MGRQGQKHGAAVTWSERLLVAFSVLIAATSAYGLFRLCQDFPAFKADGGDLLILVVGIGSLFLSLRGVSAIREARWRAEFA